MVSPKRFLPPESEPWGRSVDQDLAQIKIDNAKALSEFTNAFKAINSSMKLVSKQIAELTALTTALEQQQNTLAAQQATLAQTVAGMVAIDYASVSEMGFGTALTDQDRAVGAIAVPAGYTRALVSVTVVAGARNSGANYDYLYASAVIAGVKSREMPNGAVSTGTAASFTSKVLLLTGLSGGSITVGARIHTQGAAWDVFGSNRVYVEASAIFLR